MAGWDELTDDIAERFDLRRKEARALVHEVLSLIAAQPGRIDGVKAAGLEDNEASWLRETYPMALSMREVKKALGAEDIERIAENVGLTESITSRVLGYAIPKTIVLLTHGSAPSETSSLVSSPGVAQFPSQRVEEFNLKSEGQVQREMEGGRYAEGLRLVVPGAALLVTLGVFGYAITSGTARDGASVQLPRVAENAPLASPQTPSMPSYQTPGNEHGPVTDSGAGTNAGNSAATSGSLNTVTSGAGKITPDLAFAARQIQNLRTAYGFGSQDSQTLFAGNEFNGTLSDTARAWMMAGSRYARVHQFGVAATTGSGAANMRTASSTSQSGSRGNESGGSPNQPTVDLPAITFPPKSAKVPSSSIPVLRRIAEQIKQLPPGTVVQVNGYTYSKRTSAADMELSQRRADSVAQLLIHEGVSPAMLSAKGNGGASVAVVANGTLERRSSTMTEWAPRDDRRVDFRVVQQRP
jgi:outer membrane protein OmpA-like peptidoglycan-associated protein